LQERAGKYSNVRNGVGWSKFDAFRASSLAEQIEEGRPMTEKDSHDCRRLTSKYGLQLLSSPHLAAVWGNESDDAHLEDAYDDYDGEDEEGGPNEYEEEPDSLDDFCTDHCIDTVFYRHEEGRFLMPAIYSEIRSLKEELGMDAAAITTALAPTFEKLSLYDVHIAIAQMFGEPAAQVGDVARAPTCGMVRTMV